MHTHIWQVNPHQPDISILSRAGDILKKGGLVAFPTETVYGLGANGLDARAVNSIYQAKGRPADNPLILHIADQSAVEKLARNIPKQAYLLMEKFWPGPLTIILARTPAVPDIVTGGLNTVALRMPQSTIALELIKLAGVPIAAPSANLSGRPSPTTAQDVLADLNGKIDVIIDGGNCEIGLESTVIDCLGEKPVILRPGGITWEMLSAVLGPVLIDPALAGDSSLKPRAPGMKYRHYAPQAPMLLIEAIQPRSYELLNTEINKALAAGKKIGLLISNSAAKSIEVNSGQILLQCYGSRLQPEQLATDLYSLLRWFDSRNVDIILAEGVEEQGLGLAVMNRMRKAAGYNILH